MSALGGFVNSTPEFIQQPQVINGVSDLIGEVFGDKGKHARAAVSAGSLPAGVAVEVDAVVEFA
jgi:enamine deaminase RidA (YjgF/YER057c/UK114 family)